MCGEERAHYAWTAVSGGGIQAAAWSARVLTGLQEASQGQFAPAVLFDHPILEQVAPSLSIAIVLHTCAMWMEPAS